MLIGKKGPVDCRQIIRCLGDWEAGCRMVTWMGGWLEIKTILVARNKNPNVIRKGAGNDCGDTMGNFADLTDVQAS